MTMIIYMATTMEFKTTYTGQYDNSLNQDAKIRPSNDNFFKIAQSDFSSLEEAGVWGWPQERLFCF